MGRISTEFEDSAIFVNYNLERLQKILNYNVSLLLLFVLSFFFGGLIFLAAIAALLLTPFLIYVLYNEKKTGWLVIFFLLVLAPMAGNLLFNLGDYSLIIDFLILGLFYFYCFLLRMQVNEWIREERAKAELAIKRKIKKENEDVGGSLHFTKF